MTHAKYQLIAGIISVAILAFVYLVWQFFLVFNSAVAYGETLSVPEPKLSGVIELFTAAPATPILFTGDVMLGRNVELLSDINGVAYPYASIAGLLGRFSVVVTNFESAIAPKHIRTRAGAFSFSTNPEYVSILAQYGVTHASLANNHALDNGTAGYTNAWNTLSQSGIVPFGHPLSVSTTSVTFIPHGDMTLAVVGVHTLFAEPDQNTLTSVFAHAASSSRYQIAYVHWGTEYETIHSAAQERFVKKLIAAGADVIIGHHPHVTQDIQMYGTVPVFFSLGNLIFDQYFSKDVQEGYALDLLFDTNQLHANIYPITSYYSRSQPQEMTAENRTTFLTDLAARSAAEYAENIKEGSLIINLELATSSQTSIIAE